MHHLCYLMALHTKNKLLPLGNKDPSGQCADTKYLKNNKGNFFPIVQFQLETFNKTSGR